MKIPSLSQMMRNMWAFAPLQPRQDTCLRGVIEQVVSVPGKMMRASLLLGVAGVVGMPEEGASMLASAVEYYHGASLILDDLPSMDDAKIRRGRICPHLTFGEAPTILGALALINRAYTLVGIATAELPADRRLRVNFLLDECLGINGLTGGQACDLAPHDLGFSVNEVNRIALTKTCALLKLSLLLPAMVMAVEHRVERHLKALGIYWGLAYQALDDLIDIDGTPETSGKTAGRDSRNNRPNLVIAVGEQEAERRMERWLLLSRNTVMILVGINPSWAFLHTVEVELMRQARSRKSNAAA